MQDCIFRHKNTIFNLSNLLKGIKLANHYCSASRFDAFLGQFGVMSIWTGLEWIIVKIPDKVGTRASGWSALCIGRQMKIPDISVVIFPDINVV